MYVHTQTLTCTCTHTHYHKYAHTFINYTLYIICIINSMDPELVRITIEFGISYKNRKYTV